MHFAESVTLGSKQPSNGDGAADNEAKIVKLLG